MQLVIIKWLDAHTTELDELTPEEIDTQLHFGYETTSYGVLIKSNADGVSYCSDIQQGPDGSIHYRCAHFVPRGMIVWERTRNLPALGRAPLMGSPAKNASPRNSAQSAANPAKPRRKARGQNATSADQSQNTAESSAAPEGRPSGA
jgi:hypothetical protein